MVTTRSQTEAHREKFRALDRARTGYTFVDEMWRLRTVRPQRYFTSSGAPARPAPCVGYGDVPDRLAAQEAEAEDLQLWGSSSSVEEYEERKRRRDEQRRAERQKISEWQGTFTLFPHLPPELRLRIWAMAMEEPTKVKLTVSKYSLTFPGPGSRCGTVSTWPTRYAATAQLPPLMLVNREAHTAAAAHYRRAFRGVDGEGGVLAAYPTVLEIGYHCRRGDMLRHIDGDMGLVQEMVDWDSRPLAWLFKE